MADDKLPTGRVARSAKLGRLAATQAARQAGTRAANVGRSEDRKRVALEKRQVEAAGQIVTALGTMKGAAMKIGQTLSFLDVGLVPEEYREDFQRKLAELRDSAPNVAFKDMRAVMEEGFGDTLANVFQSFDEVPIAAASIGQVYRATARDGRRVVVKVQYPGVAQAVRADMQNLGLILRLLRSIAPGLDPKAIGAEIRDRIYEELDYELEATNQRTLARVYRGHPFIVIPDVVSDLCSERVIVSEYVDGMRFEEVKSLPQDQRDRAGEIIFRFYFGSMYIHRRFSGDPHPGNALLQGDGRMAFLDFGLFKTLPAEAAEVELQAQRLAIEGRGRELIDFMHAERWIGDPSRYTPEGALEEARDLTWWYTEDREVTLTPEDATEVFVTMGDPRSKYFNSMRHETLPPDHLFGRRVEMLTLAVLGQLGATANWHRIAREWIYGDEPVTELGRAEAAWRR